MFYLLSRKGFIVLEDIARILPRVPSSTISVLFKHLDLENDGKIDLRELSCSIFDLLQFPEENQQFLKVVRRTFASSETESSGEEKEIFLSLKELACRFASRNEPLFETAPKPLKQLLGLKSTNKSKHD
jgi:hypothetical protein